MGLLKYTVNDIRKEAEMYLAGKSIPSIAAELKMPVSTVSWHLIHPLKDIDYRAWVVIRCKLLNRARNKDRQECEEFAIGNSGIAIDDISAEIDEINLLRSMQVRGTT